MFRKGMAGTERQQDRYNMLLLFRSYYMMLGPKGQKSSRKQACIGFPIFLPRYHYIQEEFLHLFPRATSQADMLACPFGDCREGQIPRSLLRGI